MTDKEVRKRLNRMRELANELAAEAKARYGREGHLFYESEGHFYIMDGDNCEGCEDRQKSIRFQSDGICVMGCGSW